MTLSEGLRAARLGVAWSSGEHIGLLRVSGPTAFDLLDAVCPRPLFLRDGQALHALLLDEQGRILADLYVLADDLDYLLMIEGMTAAEARAWLRARAPAAASDVEITDLSETHTVHSLHGPYAWELMARATTPDMLGVGYLGFFVVPAWDTLALRAGKTGEYGYDLIVPRARLAEVIAAIEQAGDDMALAEASLAELDLCSLENGFFSIRTPGVRALTPVHLQLQWRIDTRRSFPGAEALRALQADPPPRACWLLGPDTDAPPPPGAPITGDATGSLLTARWSPLLGRLLGFGLLQRDRAHPGQVLEIAGAEWRSVTSPVLQNRSLFIDTQRHAWEGREADAFPPIVP
jgi:glycine cleavage system aminomethyltransferase T